MVPLCAKHCASRALAHLILTHSEVHPLIIAILQIGTWGTKGLSNLHKVSTSQSSRGEIWPQTVWLQSLCDSPRSFATSLACSVLGLFWMMMGPRSH